MTERHRLGAMLLDAHLLSEEQLKMSMDFQKEVGGKLGAIIVKLGFLEDSTLTNFLAKQQGLDKVDLSELILPEILVKRVPQKLIERHHILPIHFAENVLTLATSDPFDYEAIEEVQLSMPDLKIEMKLAPRSQILRSISELFHADPEEVVLKEKSKETLLRELDSEGNAQDRIASVQLRDALIPLLIQKGVITREELAQKARDLESSREKEPAR
jgi:type IV pilus assembly protein PilB